MKINAILPVLVLMLITTVKAQNNNIPRSGVYKEIDTERHMEAIQMIYGSNNTLKQRTIDSILKNPNYYIPPVIYAVSHALYNQNRKDEAMFWFYVAQLRTRYDSNLCLDETARGAVGILNNEYGPVINTYAFKNPDKLEKTVERVVDFVRTNEEKYDHRWINLHGMEAIMAGTGNSQEKKEISEPIEKWPEIKKKTIDDYYDGFLEYVKNK